MNIDDTRYTKAVLPSDPSVPQMVTGVPRY